MENLFDFNELEFEFGSLEGAEDAFDFEFETVQDTRIIKPPYMKPKMAYYKNAKEASKQMPIKKGVNYFGIIHGSFIFGDLLEAILVGQNKQAARLDIQTLSLSQDNIDSLRTLLEKNYILELNLIVSDYYYVHERNLLIPYIHQELDIDDRFQLSVAGLHTKIITANLNNGVKLCIHGSANLRSSGNIEQIIVQDSPEIYTFVTKMNDQIIQKYKTINKSIRRAKLWQTVVVENGQG